MPTKHVAARPSATFFFILLTFILLLAVCFFPTNVLPHQSSHEDFSSSVRLALPSNITALHIDIGPNTTPLLPPDNESQTAMLVVEPIVAIAHDLRERFQKGSHPGRFFTLCAAVSGTPLSGGVASFRHYNELSQSSSLSEATAASREQTWTDPNAVTKDSRVGPGPAGLDFVPVLSLGRLLAAVPANVSIPLLKTDAQGHDLAIIKSSPIAILRRVKRIRSEVYLGNIVKKRYEGVKNNLEDWLPYMKTAGFKLEQPVPKGGDREWDAMWVRVDKL